MWLLLGVVGFFAAAAVAVASSGKKKAPDKAGRAREAMAAARAREAMAAARANAGAVAMVAPLPVNAGLIGKGTQGLFTHGTPYIARDAAALCGYLASESVRLPVPPGLSATVLDVAGAGNRWTEESDAEYRENCRKSVLRNLRTGHSWIGGVGASKFRFYARDRPALWGASEQCHAWGRQYAHASDARSLIFSAECTYAGNMFEAMAAAIEHAYDIVVLGHRRRDVILDGALAYTSGAMDWLYEHEVELITTLVTILEVGGTVTAALAGPAFIAAMSAVAEDAAFLGPVGFVVGAVAIFAIAFYAFVTGATPDAPREKGLEFPRRTGSPMKIREFDLYLHGLYRASLLAGVR